MYYDPINSLFLCILVGVSVYVFWKYVLKIAMFEIKYKELYNILKLEEQLKERNITFEDLDMLEERLIGKKSCNLNDIDEYYEKQKKQNNKKAK